MLVYIGAMSGIYGAAPADVRRFRSSSKKIKNSGAVLTNEIHENAECANVKVKN